MIIYKSPDEIAKMRRAGRITADAIVAMLDEVAPGKTTADLDAIAERSDPRRRRHARRSCTTRARTRPRSVRRSTTEIVPASRRAQRVLKTGDVLSLDCGAIWDGFQETPPSPRSWATSRRHRRRTSWSGDGGRVGGRDRRDRPGGRLSDRRRHPTGGGGRRVLAGAGVRRARDPGGRCTRTVHQNFGSPGRGPEMKPA